MSDAFSDWLREDRVVAIVRSSSAEAACAAAGELITGGIRLLEFSLSGEGAVKAIQETAAAYKDRALIGAGTVLSIDQASQAVNAGARFLVSPTLVPDVLTWASEREIPVVPGAMTPSEIWQAHTAGAAFIKVFPAAALGPPYIRALLGPFPHLHLIPTGGVSLADSSEYIRAGATAVALASALTDSAAAGDSGLAQRARDLLARLRATRDVDVP